MVNHRSSPHCGTFAFGAIDQATGDTNIDEVRLQIVRSYAVSRIPRCQDCFSKWHCSGGCRVFQTVPFSQEPPNEMCAVTRALTKRRILTEMRLFDEAGEVRLERLTEAA